MTPIETDPIDPIDPIGPIGSGNSGGRPRKPSGGAQAITMILAWVGGAAAAVAAAFWILQFVKPAARDPKPESNDRPAIAQNHDGKIRSPKSDKPKSDQVQSSKQKSDKLKPEKTETDPVKPNTNKVAVDVKNFQRPKQPGLRYRYYSGESFGVSDFATAAPSRKGLIVKVEDLPNAKEAKGLQLKGYWKTESNQPCDFVLDSTNGARLWIDDQLVLDNTAQFQREPVKASRTIKPGMHAVRAEFVLSTQRGSFKLEVGASENTSRFNLTELLRPFEPKDMNNSINQIRYDLAKSPKPVADARSLIEKNRNDVEAGFVERVSAPPADAGVTVETLLPEDGRLLAGLVVSTGGGKISAIQPVYLDEYHRFLGKQVGRKDGIWRRLIAKPGFAVSAIGSGTYNSSKDLSLEFRRIGSESLLPADAYTRSLSADPVSISVSDSCDPVIGLQVYTSQNPRIAGIDAIRVRSSGDRVLTILVDGLPVPPDRKQAPSPAVAKKELKKLMKESAARLQGKAGSAQLMELKALAESTANDGRNSVSDQNRFVSLLEARRLHLLAGNFESAFKIMDEISQNFEYDRWEDQLLFFGDAAKRAGKSTSMQRKVAKGLGPVIAKAEDSFEFETAGRLAAGGKMLATGLRDQKMFDQFNAQLEEFERSAAATKQARAAARTLINNPDDPKANRALGIFSLVVTKDWGAAMKYFARSSNKDCEFIAEHDRSFDATDSETAIKLADCWKRIGRKNDEIEKLAVERAQKILIEAKTRAIGKALRDIEADLERL